MKKHFLFAILLIVGIATTFGQVGIGTDIPNNSSILDVESTTQGFLPPRMTEAQRDDIPSPAEGLVVYNTTEKCLNYWNTTKWVSICDGAEPAPFVCGDAVNGKVSFTYNGAEVTYGTVESATGKCWLDRNLGASRAATAFDDYQAYGDLFQWGRAADGHQLINWTSATTGTPVNGTTTTLSGSDTPENNLFITNNILFADWRSPRNDNLWQGVDGINNPCPTGFRVPVIEEFTAEFTQYSITNSETAYASPLKFAIPGYRYNSDGSLLNTGNIAEYWSSSVNTTNATVQYFHSNIVTVVNRRRTNGFPVRCIKD